MGCSSFLVGCTADAETIEVEGGGSKAEEEPEGEIIVGLRGEVLRPPDEGTTST